MIRLDSLREPVWLDLPHGVRLLCDVHDAVADMAGLQAFRDALKAEPDNMAAAELAEVVAVARQAVRAWEGVGTSSGAPLPCTPDGVEALLRQIGGMALAFRLAFYAKRAEVEQEKNACAGSPSGTSTREPEGVGASAA